MNEHEIRYAHDAFYGTDHAYRFCGVIEVEVEADIGEIPYDEDLMTDGELHDRYGYGYP